LPLSLSSTASIYILQPSPPPPDLHSFPTRRSSDLRGGAPPAANVKEVWAVRPTWSCRGTTRRSRTRRRSRTDSCTVHPQTRARSASKLLANHTSISLLANAPAAPSPAPAISSPAARSVGRPAGTRRLTELAPPRESRQGGIRGPCRGAGPPSPT